jgi:hypothetical protein
MRGADLAKANSPPHKTAPNPYSSFIDRRGEEAESVEFARSIVGVLAERRGSDSDQDSRIGNICMLCFRLPLGK